MREIRGRSSTEVDGGPKVNDGRDTDRQRSRERIQWVRSSSILTESLSDRIPGPERAYPSSMAHCPIDTKGNNGFGPR